MWGKSSAEIAEHLGKQLLEIKGKLTFRGKIIWVTALHKWNFQRAVFPGTPLPLGSSVAYMGMPGEDGGEHFPQLINTTRTRT